MLKVRRNLFLIVCVAMGVSGMEVFEERTEGSVRGRGRRKGVGDGEEQR